MISFKQLIEKISDYRSIVLLGHIHPDGDCIGATLALQALLRSKKIKTTVILREVPSTYDYLDGYHAISETINSQPEVMVLLDCADISRIAPYKQYFECAKLTINIDHHASNNHYADINYVEEEASSTCEMLYQMVDDKQLIDQAVAAALYTGIIYDTGVFKHSNTTGKTMRIAGRLMDVGIDFGSMIRRIFYVKTEKDYQAIELALQNMTMIANNQVVLTALRYEQIAQYHLTKGDLEYVIQIITDRVDAKASVFISELAKGQFKLSFRSNSQLDVCQVAQIFGGGGHIKAAGAGTFKSYDEIVSMIERSMLDQLKG